MLPYSTNRALVIGVFKTASPADIARKCGCGLTAIAKNARTFANIHATLEGIALNIVSATQSYEDWARKRITIVESDLKLKHQKMAEAAFPFFRATFYRWVTLWHDLCGDLAKGPALLAVGDLHIENFGTWRDAEGRLVWGVNDFDEAFPMSYANDLVRLAASALLAIDDGDISLSPAEACSAILSGYTDAIKKENGKAFVLEETHPELRAMALGTARDPTRFWSKLEKSTEVEPPKHVAKLLRKQLPNPKAPIRILHRTAGLGSLGRDRFVALADWHDGKVAREAKAMLPSACVWAGGNSAERPFYDKIVDHAVRVPDPFLKTKKGWVLRRLSPHCTRIPLADYPKSRDELRILKSMGSETANIHFGTKSAIADIRGDLGHRPKEWLQDAASRMTDAIREDWQAWRKSKTGNASRS